MIDNTIDCIYPWMLALKTCFHVTSNVFVSGVKLWSFPPKLKLTWPQTSMFQVSNFDVFPPWMWKSHGSLSFLSSQCRNLRKTFEHHWYGEAKKYLSRETSKFDAWNIITWNIDVWSHVSLSLGGETAKLDIWNIDIWHHVKTCF